MSLSQKAINGAEFAKWARSQGWGATSDGTSAISHACNCIGPQNGDPVCPCQMRGVAIRNGRYVRVIDLGPAPADSFTSED